MAALSIIGHFQQVSYLDPWYDSASDKLKTNWYENREQSMKWHLWH